MQPSEKQTRPLYESDNHSVIEALDRAHLIAFAPYVWEATRILVDKGILKLINDANTKGLSLEELLAQVDISEYGLRILLEAGLGIRILNIHEDRYTLAKTGFIFLNNEMTKVNYEFMRDVCMPGFNTLATSIEQSKPLGLKAFGDWNTIYQGLPMLPQPAKNSWFGFDHFYSDGAFPEALKIVFDSHPPKRLLDIGGNTGKWTLQCLAYNDTVHMGIVDLGVQLNVAKHNIDDAGYSDRVQYHEQNILDNALSLPQGYDAIWMSQFLDCFSDNEIVNILKKCHAVSDENTRIFINETFWDKQKFETSAFALQMTSFYFTTMANGNSQMYDSKVFYKLIDKAGFSIVNEHNGIGLSHTILELIKK